MQNSNVAIYSKASYLSFKPTYTSGINLKIQSIIHDIFFLFFAHKTVDDTRQKYG